jgi:hypothetical protein
MQKKTNSLTPEEAAWLQWLELPQTKILRKALEARRENLKEQLAEGEFVESQSLMLYAATVAQCKLLKDIAELNYELFITEIEDGKH